MKIQELAIIFIIIILPITIVLSVYTQLQIKTVEMQTAYDSKLTAATADALKAFQINTSNSTISDISNSKIRDIEASVETFKNSLKSTFGLNGYTEEEMNQYIPALVYTMYDGFYIYSPFLNQNGYEINNDNKNIYGLKPYISYSARYITNSVDVIITYTLDNYITIQGKINNKYINTSGYLIDGIQATYDDNGNLIQLKYNGIEIKREENLKEFVNGIEYPYIRVNGTKYYYDETKKIVFYISNGTATKQYEGEVAKQYYENTIKNNTMAIQYYEEAYKFKQKLINEYPAILELEYEDCYDVIYNEENQQYELKQLWTGSDKNTKIFEFNKTNEYADNIECKKSKFNQHRLEIIRRKIASNLSVAIANYNSYSSIGVEFQMPELKEEEWEHVMNNISLISFVQGLDIGGKIYNGYTIVNNSESKEVVREEKIYILGTDNFYHKINEKNLEDIVRTDIPAGRLNLDFERASLKNGTQVVYYYTLKQYASYNSITTQNETETYDDIYVYVNNLDSTKLKEAFFTALGRERKGSYKNENLVT